MEKKEINITVSVDLFEKLESIAQQNKSSIEEAAGKILSESLQNFKPAPKPKPMPGVALIKEGAPAVSPIMPAMSKPELARSDFFPESQVEKPTLSPEKLQRRKQLEARMQEVAMLIQTAANEEKRQEYSMQYALLAAEIEAIV